MQTQKVEKGSQAYQAGGHITINNGPSYDEINRIVESLLKINTPLIVQEASEKAIKQVEEFIQEFLSGLKDEADIQIIQESLKQPRAQYLLKEGMESTAKYGDAFDLKLLAKAVQTAMLENDDEKTQLAMSASDIIPKLHKQQLLFISIMWFVQIIFISGDSFSREPAKSLESWINLLVSIPENTEISNTSKYHFITLGVCTFNQFSGGSSEDELENHYKGVFKANISPLLNDNDIRVSNLKRVCDIYDKNKLNQFHLTPVGACIAYLAAVARGVDLPKDLFGQY